jgi:hypothetical protein
MLLACPMFYGMSSVNQQSLRKYITEAYLSTIKPQNPNDYMYVMLSYEKNIWDCFENTLPIKIPMLYHLKH